MKFQTVDYCEDCKHFRVVLAVADSPSPSIAYCSKTEKIFGTSIGNRNIGRCKGSLYNIPTWCPLENCEENKE